jgi:REP element-mobilizing transposase RayT
LSSVGRLKADSGFLREFWNAKPLLSGALDKAMAFSRRHLPHWIPERTALFVTWRLAGSLPREVEALATEDRPQKTMVCPTAFLEHDRRLDGCFGPVWLQDSRIATMVMDALVYGEAARYFYQLYAWVIMPNHVHVILEPHVAMPTIMRWVKGRTSRVANQILGRTGLSFWQDESFDHWVRTAEELYCLIDYVENNPVKAGLTDAPEQWRWSSAGRKTDDKTRSSVLLDPTSSRGSPARVRWLRKAL